MSIQDLLGLGSMANWHNSQTLQMQNVNMCFLHNERFTGNMCPHCARSSQQVQSGLAGIAWDPACGSGGTGGILVSNGTGSTTITTTNTTGTTITAGICKPSKIDPSQILGYIKKKSKVLLLLNH